MEKRYARKGSTDRKYNKPGAIKNASPRHPIEPSEGLVIGRNAVRELLAGGRDIEKIYIRSGEREGSINLLIGEAAARRIPIVEADKSRLDAMCGGAAHQGIIALAAEKNYCTVSEILEYAASLGEKPFIVLCDGVEDPHNLGAIIRSAECCGAHGVIIPKRRAVGLTSVVSKSSAGALEHMRIAKVTNLASVMDELKEEGLWFYAADMGGEAYEKTDLAGSVGLVLGSEGEGISRLVKEKCDFTVSIPMYGRVNSLNVSAAAAVLLSEIARQRRR
ncbi:MAG: 23S rRNA (guanosine(2251)-2'-O)-methyltransferase RlmB [Clostridia bacterium]|nr:23S rRNA (guanosine(2251)-2'-O)-methyltransferase RlmB [Clostridia bacterium]